MGASGRYERYQGLFEAPSGSDLENQYRAIVGDDFTSVDPTFQAVFDSVSSATLSDDALQSKNVCDSSIYESMDLDDIIIACMYHQIEEFCPASDSSEKFRTFLKSVQWRLPKITFDWRARCAPFPPPRRARPRAAL